MTFKHSTKNTVRSLLIFSIMLSAVVFSTACGANQETLTASVTPDSVETNVTTPVSSPSSNVQYMLSTTIDPPGAGSATPERTMYAGGTEAAVNATAAPGFKFDYWSGDIQNMSASTTLIMDGNKNIVAHFKALFRLTTSVDTIGTGTISPSEGYYDPGTEVKVTANSAVGYTFDHWSGDIENNDNPQTITMNKSKKLVAYFNPNFVNIIEGKKKNLFKVIGYGTKYLNFLDVTITSNIKSNISVSIQPGIVFESPNQSVNFIKMVNLDKKEITLIPGESQKIRLHTASINGLCLTPSESDQMALLDTVVEGDLALLLKPDSFYTATFRVQQFAIWVIVMYPQSINGIKIGSGKSESSYTSASLDEFDQINKLFTEAGIDKTKYCLTYIDPNK